MKGVFAMSKRVTVPLEIKKEVVLRCIRNESNPGYEAKRLKCYRRTVTDWIRKYKKDGLEGLKESTSWKNYSAELKRNAVNSVLSGELSTYEAVEKYNISDRSVLKKWISKYTSGEEIKSTRKGKYRMNKGRKTTYKERIQIAQFTIANDFDYQKAIETYGVSYQQVYSWVRKYKESGETALRDNRGRKKPEEELDDNERLKLRIKELEARNAYLEMESDFAKKLSEIQRRNTNLL
jgi:transposase-like protein